MTKPRYHPGAWRRCKSLPWRPRRMGAIPATRGTSTSTTATLAQLQHVLASDWGHFSHANSWRLRRALLQRHAWLQVLFTLGERGDMQPLWVLPGCTLAQQLDGLRQLWPHACCIVQKGVQVVEVEPIESRRWRSSPPSTGGLATPWHTAARDFPMASRCAAGAGRRGRAVNPLPKHNRRVFP